MRYTFFIILFCVTSGVIGQTFELSSVEFVDGEQPIANPYIGGLKAGQFSNVDLNLDGMMDLIVFDRVGSIITPLIATEDSYVYTPSYRSIFPPARNWLLMRDYNGDGIQDIFCSPTAINIPGVEVWKGVINDGVLSYELIRFPDRDFDIIYVPLGRGFTQAYVSVIDLPDISDIDGDGDLDIVAFEPSGSFVFYYKNTAVELGLSLDELSYELGDQCFGKFLESGFSEEISLSSNELECASFLRPDGEILVANRHSGSTITLIDPDGDGLKDVLLGDISYNGLVELKNGGTKEFAWMIDQNARWPAGNDPVELELFLSTFEVSYLGDTSLIITSNDRSSGQSQDFVWQYIYSDEIQDYQLQKKNLLIDEMIFHGKNTRPIFFDHNGDGLMDILIGSNGTNNDGALINPRLYLYENIGVKENPKYSLKDDDYLDFSQFANTSRWFAPSVGDIDGDQDLDMIIGDDTGQLYYVENQSGLSSSLNFKNPVYEAFGIKLSAFATPSIVDINQDGLADLVIGEQNFNSVDGRLGSFNYFENMGSVENASFNDDINQVPNDGALGNVYLRDENFVSNFSSATFYDNGEQLNMLAANEAGTILYYEDIKGISVQDSFTVTSDITTSVFEGLRSTPDVADIDNDGLLELIVGNSRGGVALYETNLVAIESIDSVVDLNHDNMIVIKNNPSSLLLEAEITDNKREKFTWHIYDMAGRLHRSVLNEFNISIDITGLNSGTYMLTAEHDNSRYTSKFIKVK